MESFQIESDGFLISYERSYDVLYVRYLNDKICGSDMIHDKIIFNLNPEQKVRGMQILNATQATSNTIARIKYLHGNGGDLKYYEPGFRKLVYRVESLLKDISFNLTKKNVYC